MPGGSWHVIAVFIEYSRGLPRWVLRYKPESDVVMVIPTLREIARVPPRGPVYQAVIGQGS